MAAHACAYRFRKAVLVLYMLLPLFLLNPLSARQEVVDGKWDGTVADSDVQGGHGLILGRSTRRALNVVPKDPEGGPGCCHPIRINSGPHGRPGN
ncbi:hypothetical protein GQ55_1G083400 [Panicum hallii var. hallii]|uniref:Uncharacterized protein n=1 Tax=Panicum hallii var. hallii TaxID=1504633 RepID=A0A2T7F3J9_9POAL|nr:hypothetical protein GQ55_1G083400 [Panicum hallii var. hallii]